MKKDGTLTKAEQSTLRKAFYILDDWARAHRMDDNESTVNAILDVVVILNRELPVVLSESQEHERRKHGDDTRRL